MGLQQFLSRARDLPEYISGGRITLPNAPPASANYGLFNLGSGPFDGSTSGFFAGNSSGTLLAGNAASGYEGKLLDLQRAGTHVLRADYDTLEFTSIRTSAYSSNTIPQGPLVISAESLVSTVNVANYIAGGGALRFWHANGSKTNPTAVTVNQDIGKITFRPRGATLWPTYTGNTPGFYAFAEENVTDSAGGIFLLFCTAASGGLAGQNHFRLNGNGSSDFLLGRVNLSTAPSASANYGLLNLGSGPFDGATSGFFTGSSSGTVYAANAASGYAGRLFDFQVAGVSRLRGDPDRLEIRASATSTYSSGDGPLVVSSESAGCPAHFYGYGSVSVVLRGMSANGTRTSPTAKSANEILATVSARPYGATGFVTYSGPGAPGVYIIAEENVTDSAGGQFLRFVTAAPGALVASGKMDITGNGNIVMGSAALATNATDGFPYIPSCAGAPTGIPTTLTGLCPIVVDSSNLRIYTYVGGAWKYAALT